MSQPQFPVVLTHDTIVRRIHELAREVQRAYPDAPPLLLAVMDGARVFAEHLRRLLPGQLPCAEVRAKSYGDGTVSSGRVEIFLPRDLDVAGREVLLIEDIVDTGRTVLALQERLLADGARAVRVASLLSKPSRRVVQVALDWVGFEIPDEFVIGFGMDVAGRYRDLPYVGIYQAELERA